MEKLVYQKIIDPDHGDCMRACLCTLLGISDEGVENFIEYPDWWERMETRLKSSAGKKWGKIYYNPKAQELENPRRYCFKKRNGFSHELSLPKIRPEDTIDGLLLGGVYSPGYDCKHCVIVDQYCNIVFDPNPKYKEIYEYPYAGLIGFNGVCDVWGTTDL